ncbi:UNVERIFIED_CONTAM: hypothetical protein RMT77_011829 [Armadillidium vulgare]
MVLRNMKFQTSLNTVAKRERNLYQNVYPSPPPSPEVSSENYEESPNLKFSDTVETRAPFNDNIVSKPLSRHKWLKSKSKKVKNSLSREALFPNWCSKEANTRPTKRRDFNFKKDGYATRCYVCENRVTPSHLQYHLYFGNVKCEDCGRVFTSCFKYSNPNFFTSKNGTYCPHLKLDFVFPAVDNLKRLWDEDEETFDKSLELYLKSLGRLKSIEPFKKAITCCKNYLKMQKLNSRNSSELEESYLCSTDFDGSINYTDITDTNNNTITDGASKLEESYLCSPSFSDDTSYNDSSVTNITTTVGTSSTTRTASYETKLDFENISEGKLSQTQNIKPSEKDLSEPQEIVLISPENESYLISKEIIEECPNCYEPFDPQSLTFNSYTWLVSVTCQNCSLLVYFLLDPPDGGKPKLKIIHSE